MTDDPGPLGAAPALVAALADRYRIERELGAGGMATVYLAEDLKHHRQVAVKVLRPELAAVIGAERFLAEIRTTANLQHPHILPLFDSGEADGFLFYVMPYVEGETVRNRIEREKQLPIPDAVRIATEVASALDYAHRHGVIHRDIKPENILLHDGRALVADFGIALAVSTAGTRMTETGMSLGTPHYMSPEQAMGEREITARSDVYALGCVLYEMLTGDPPFTGSTAQAIVARVLTETPRPMIPQRHTIPPHVDAAVFTALEKLPADRFATAAEFAAALDDTKVAKHHVGPVRRDARPGARQPRTVAVLVTVAVLALATGWSLHTWLRHPATPAPVRFAFTLGHRGIELGYVGISPDGRRVAMGVADSAGILHVVQRDLGSTILTAIAGTEGGDAPRYSLDGQWISFFVDGKIKKVPAQGGTPTLVADSVTFTGAGWLPDGSVVFSRTDGLWLAPASGGVAKQVTHLDAARHEFAHWDPEALPDGHTIIYTSYTTPISQSRIEAYDLKTHRRTVLVENAVFPRYASNGCLLYTRDRAIFAVAFDAATLTVRGTPVPVQSDVSWNATDGLGSYDVSQNGTLVYLRASAWDVSSEVVWVDRGGQATRALSDTGSWSEPRISPDGRWLAVTVEQPKAAIWLYDTGRRILTPLTHADGVAFNAVWTPDSRSIVYSFEHSEYDLHQLVIDGSAPDRGLVLSQRDKYASSVSPDGQWLAYTEMANGEHDMLAPMDGKTAPHPMDPDASANQRSAMFSPDGRWLAYEEESSGQYDVYLRAAGGSGGRRQVSADGGSEPRWTRSGRELVYRRGTAMMAAEIDPATGDIGTPVTLFHSPALDGLSKGRDASYDVTPDGNRFLMVWPIEQAGSPTTVVVLNWFTELRSLVKP